MIKEDIKSKLTQAMKDRDELTVSVLRGLLSAFTNELVAQKKKPQDELSDEEVQKVIKKSAKQRQDSIEQFKNGGREDLAEQEEKELAILKEFLPEEMSDEDVQKIVENKKLELGVEDKSKMGILMGAIMKEVSGRADGTRVKELLENSF